LREPDASTPSPLAVDAVVMEIGVTSSVFLEGKITATGNSPSGIPISSCFYERGTKTFTTSGLSPEISGVSEYTRVGNSITINFPDVLGTSNNTLFQIIFNTNFPTYLRPTREYTFPVVVRDNGFDHFGKTGISPTSPVPRVMGFSLFDSSSDGFFSGGFTSAGEKGVGGFSISYLTSGTNY